MDAEVGEGTALEGDTVGHAVRGEVCGGVETCVIQGEATEVVGDAAAGGETALIAKGQCTATDDGGTRVRVKTGQCSCIVARTGEGHHTRACVLDDTAEGATTGGSEDRGRGCRGVCDRATGGGQRANAGHGTDGLIVADEIKRAAVDLEVVDGWGRGGREDGKGVVFPTFELQGAFIYRCGISGDEELRLGELHRAGASLDEAVGGLVVGVEGESVHRVHLVDVELSTTC